MKVLFVTPECVPFAKAGGLGDVVGALPKALHKRGIDARVLMPRYGFMTIEDAVRLPDPLGVPYGTGEAWCGVLESRLPGSDVPVYFLEHDALFERPAPYLADGLHALGSFGLLCRGAFQLSRALNWIPDVMHVHDWPTAPLASMLATVERASPFDGTASVMTIHNMAHQPRFEVAGLELLGLPASLFHPGALEDHGEVNPFKGGCLHATMLTAVSPTYAEEIRGDPGGCGLDPLMRARGADLVGIVNGIDTDVWNPATDRSIAASFSVDHPGGKRLCKAALQSSMGLAVAPEIPLIGVVSRWVTQKGTDVLVDALDRILALGAQVAMLGSGEPHLEALLAARSAEHDGRFAAKVGYDEVLAHQIEAGADFFCMPSRFEPCGLNQLYSQRYGTLPIVRATGGLVDTVTNCDPATGSGTGFVFWDLTADALVGTVAWAVDLFRSRPDLIAQMRLGAMRKASGWATAAGAYESVYARSIDLVRA